MAIDLPVRWVLALNILGPPLVQLACAYLFLRLPDRWFAARPGTREREIWLWEKCFHVNSWKQRLPDGAAWLNGGFAKSKLASHRSTYLRRYLIETRRGEACHWAAMAIFCTFFAWNPPWADLVIGLYALLANFPCIIVQRYNRARINRSLLRNSR